MGIFNSRNTTKVVPAIAVAGPQAAADLALAEYQPTYNQVGQLRKDAPIAKAKAAELEASYGELLKRAASDPSLLKDVQKLGAQRDIAVAHSNHLKTQLADAEALLGEQRRDLDSSLRALHQHQLVELCVRLCAAMSGEATTIAREMRELLVKYAKDFGRGDHELSFPLVFAENGMLDAILVEIQNRISGGLATEEAAQGDTWAAHREVHRRHDGIARQRGRWPYLSRFLFARRARVVQYRVVEQLVRRGVAEYADEAA